MVVSARDALRTLGFRPSKPYQEGALKRKSNFDTLCGERRLRTSTESDNQHVMKDSGLNDACGP